MKHALTVLTLTTLLAAAGCSHSYVYTRGPTAGTMSNHKLSGKSIAFDLSGTPESYKTSLGGVSYSAQGIRRHAEEMLRGMFRNDRIVAVNEADVILALETVIKMSSTFFGTKCRVTSRWQIRDRLNAVVATGEATDKASFGTTSNAGRNCEIAGIKSMSAALDKAMAQLPGNREKK